jgi:hypothetical protein
MPPEILEGGVVVTQILKGPFAHDTTLVEDIYIVEAGQQMKAVHGGDDRFVGEGLEEPFIDHRFRPGVYAAGRLIQQHQLAVAGGKDAPG